MQEDYSNRKNKQVEFLEKHLTRTIGFCQNCDTKSSIILAFIGVFIAGFILDKDFRQVIFDNSGNCLFITLVISSLVILLYAIFFLLNSLKARLDSSKYGVETTSLLFFGNIAKSESFKEFAEKMKSLDDSKIEEDFLTEIYVNSKICDIKYRNFNKGLSLSLIGIAILLLSFLFFRL